MATPSPPSNANCPYKKFTNVSNFLISVLENRIGTASLLRMLRNKI